MSKTITLPTLVFDGAVITSGLSVGGLITEVVLNSTTWTALPATPFAGRNAIAIQNDSGIQIKINHDSGVGTFTGMVVNDGGERQYNISDSIVIFAKSASGTPTVTVEEIA